VVVKWDSGGNTQWVRQISAGMGGTAYGVAVDGAGNVYATGGIYGAFPGQNNSGEWDCGVVKWDSSGNLQWARQIGSASDEEGMAIAAGVSGYVYVTGWTMGVMGPVGFGNEDVFVAAFTDQGERY
jgi:hypothetical protein